MSVVSQELRDVLPAESPFGGAPAEGDPLASVPDIRVSEAPAAVQGDSTDALVSMEVEAPPERLRRRDAHRRSNLIALIAALIGGGAVFGAVVWLGSASVSTPTAEAPVRLSVQPTASVPVVDPTAAEPPAAAEPARDEPAPERESVASEAPVEPTPAEVVPEPVEAPVAAEPVEPVAAEEVTPSAEALAHAAVESPATEAAPRARHHSKRARPAHTTYRVSLPRTPARIRRLPARERLRRAQRLRRRASRYFARGNDERATALWLLALQHLRTDVTSMRGVAKAAARRRRFEEAIGWARHALARNERDANSYRVLGDIYRQAGRSREARRAYRQGLRLKPRDRQLRRRVRALSRASG